MERFTVSLDENLLADFDDYCQRKGYQNRSEAVRDLLRSRLDGDRLEAALATPDEDAQCVACLSYLYNHHERDLSRRLVEIQHHHHELAHATMHIHLDHETCLEVAVLRGSVPAVLRCADVITAETGVRHGQVHVVPIDSVNISPPRHQPHPSETSSVDPEP